MIRILARYSIKPGNDGNAAAAVRHFVEAVNANEPSTEYRAFRLDGSREFVHFMAFPDEARHQQHRQAPYTHEFVDRLYPLCEAEPEFAPIIEISAA